MKFAYLMNMYPMTSTTFIRREIESHEQAGCDVMRFSIRSWDHDLVDLRDVEEAKRTVYLLAQGWRLVAATILEIFTNPRGFARAAWNSVRLARNAPGRKIKQTAYLLEAVFLKQALLENKIEHLHTHFSTNSATVALLSHLMGGPPYSITIHGPDELFETSGNSLGLKVRHAKFVSAISQYCWWVINTHTGGAYSDKIHVVRCGLALDEFAVEGDFPENGDLVCVGRITKAKAQILLVEAICAVAKRHPDVRLLLIGDGDERPAVEARIADLGLEANISVAGWKKNEDVLRSILRSRALVLPSLAEGLPIVIMESLALGRPVVTTDAYGMPELVDAHCGWLARPGDKESLIQCLDDVLGKDVATLRSMGLVGRSRVRDFHDQASSSSKLRELFCSAP